MFALITSSFGFKCRRALARKAAEAAGRQALAATRIQAGFRGALARAQLVLQVKGTANTDCHSACWPWSPRIVLRLTEKAGFLDLKQPLSSMRQQLL